MSMTKDKIKELREWGTFILTLLTVVLVPAGILVLNNQKLEIERDADAKYATKSAVEETNAKLDKIAEDAAQMRTDLAVIKNTLAEKSHESH